MPSEISVAPAITRSVAGQFIALCYAIFLAYWIVAAFWTKKTAEKPAWSRSWLIRGAAAALLLFLSRRTAPGSPNRALWSYTPTIGVVAMALTALGLAVLLWARATLAGNWSADVVFKEDHELIERGPYEYVRHPIYSGVILMALGCDVVVGNDGRPGGSGGPSGGALAQAVPGRTPADQAFSGRVSALQIARESPRPVRHLSVILPP